MTQGDDMTDDTPITDEQLTHAGALLRAALPQRDFAPGFADRTMARLVATRAAPPPALLRVVAMQRSFRVVAAAAALAIVALGLHNTYVARVEDTSFVEAAIGLTPVSAESLLSDTSDPLQ